MAWRMTLKKENEGSGCVVSGYELEDGVLGCFLHEARHRVVALGIKERSSYWHFSDVALKDRPRRFGSDLLGMHFLCPAALSERHFGQGAHIVNPAHNSVRRDEPPFGPDFNQGDRRRPVLTGLAAGGGQEVAGLAADAETDHWGHNHVDCTSGSSEFVGLCHPHILPDGGWSCRVRASAPAPRREVAFVARRGGSWRPEVQSELFLAGPDDREKGLATGASGTWPARTPAQSGRRRRSTMLPTGLGLDNDVVEAFEASRTIEGVTCTRPG